MIQESEVSLTSPPLAIRHIAGFIAFSHGWTWAFWGAAALLGARVWEPPGVYFFHIGGAGIVIGAIVMSQTVLGPDGLADLGRRMVDTRGVPRCWWVAILLSYPLVALASAGLGTLLGVSGQPLDRSGAAARAAGLAGLLAMIFFILLIGPLPEEIGWRGYLQDRLQVRLGALVAALLVGAAWWSWHLPLFVWRISPVSSSASLRT